MLPVVAVLAVIAFVTGGSRLVGAVVEDVAVPAVQVGGTVTVTPEPGWEVVSSSQDGAVSEVLLQRGTVGLLVIAVPAAVGSTTDLARRYVDDVLRERFAQLTIGDPTVTAAQLRFGYVGTTLDGVAVEGVVAVEVGPSGAGAVFDGFAPTGHLGAAVGDLRAMVDSAEVA